MVLLLMTAFIIFYSPLCPNEMDWSKYYPTFFDNKGNTGKNGACVQFADIGCGYGGLTGMKSLHHIISHHIIIVLIVVSV